MIKFYKRAAHVGFKHCLIFGITGRQYWEKYQYISIGFKWNNIEYYIMLKILTCRNPEPILVDNDDD